MAQPSALSGPQLANWVHKTAKQITEDTGKLHKRIKDDAKAKDIELNRMKIAQARAKLKALTAQVRAAIAAGNLERAKAIAHQIGLTVKDVRTALSALKDLGATDSTATQATGANQSAASEGKGSEGKGKVKENGGPGNGESETTDPSNPATAKTADEMEDAEDARRHRTLEQDRQKGLREGESALVEARRLLDELERSAQFIPGDDSEHADLRAEIHAARHAIQAEGASSLWV
jgi:predicted  nucleic acid-binding Zn-ribbon protein